MKNDIVGHGAYTVADAAQLLQISKARLRRWVSGYTYKIDNQLTAKPALWRPYYTQFDEKILSFRDLMEARYIKAFAAAGVSIRGLRSLLKIAQNLVDDERPFSTNRFRTDGKTLFLETVNARGERLLDIKQKQHVFRKIVERTLLDVDFDDHAALRWWAAGRTKSIVIDPQIAFGKPVLHGTSIPTSRIAEVAEIEGSIKQAARLFEIDLADAKQALAYEKTLARAA
ncbi:MAG: DUF433 domain-containing protein [Pseudomonadota bacterium]